MILEGDEFQRGGPATRTLGGVDLGSDVGEARRAELVKAKRHNAWDDANVSPVTKISGKRHCTWDDAVKKPEICGITINININTKLIFNININIYISRR